jgi:Calcineurin-like phosphoesterase
MQADLPPTTNVVRPKAPPGRVRSALQRRFQGARLCPPRAFEEEVTLHQSGRFAIVGDLQRTSKVELWRESNHAERERIIRQIAAEAPDFLAIVGDLVFRGSSAADWAAFDALSTPLHEARVPVLPMLGNHEYWVSPRPALAHFFARFPHLGGRHWYSVTYGPLGLICLDSNIHWLPAARWHEQLGWYKRELQRFERDQAILGVLVLLHHPPYTNSTITRDALHVQRSFVPPFLSASKTLAMISGHVHSYERFERAGKTFLVTGGGGGPRMKLATGRRRRHPDDLFDGPPLRCCHFLMLTLAPTGLEVEMRGLHKRGREFVTLDRFTPCWVPSARPVAL